MLDESLCKDSRISFLTTCEREVVLRLATSSMYIMMSDVSVTVIGVMFTPLVFVVLMEHHQQSIDDWVVLFVLVLVTSSLFHQYCLM